MSELPGVSSSGATNQVVGKVPAPAAQSVPPTIKPISPIISPVAPTSTLPPPPSAAPTLNTSPAPEVPQEVAKLPSEKELKKKKTYKIAAIVLAILIIGVIAASFFMKSSQEPRKEATGCTEQCPGNDGVLRNCHPPEADGSSADSTCAWAGRIEPCGSQTFCCPSAGGTWTTNMTACTTVSPTATPSATITLSPTATPSATITLSPTATPSATITVSPTATPSATITLSPTATPSATITVSPTATLTATKTPTPTPTGTKTPTPTPTITPTATPTIVSNTLPQSGSVETTFLLMIASFFSIALGIAIKYKN